MPTLWTCATYAHAYQIKQSVLILVIQTAEWFWRSKFFFQKVTQNIPTFMEVILAFPHLVKCKVNCGIVLCASGWHSWSVWGWKSFSHFGECQLLLIERFQCCRVAIGRQLWWSIKRTKKVKIYSYFHWKSRHRLLAHHFQVFPHVECFLFCIEG